MKTVFEVKITMESDTAESQHEMQQDFLERLPSKVREHYIVDARITSGRVDKDDAPIQQKKNGGK